MTPVFAQSPPAILSIDLTSFIEWCASPSISEDLGVAAGAPMIAVDLRGSASCNLEPALRNATLTTLPCLFVGWAEDSHDGPARLGGIFDIILTADLKTASTCCVGVGGNLDGKLAELFARVNANPIAASSLAMLLRGSPKRDIASGLLMESATYSALQGGSEFRRWRAASPRRSVTDFSEPRVRSKQIGADFHIELTRPERHNAVDSAMRDALDRALTEAEAAPGGRIVLSGQGPSFCSGGDLDEFGSSPDPATSHTVRMSRSPARRLSLLSERLEAYVHGACIGAGIELAAFASRIVAHSSTTLALPEVAMGLIPGSGGTVSVAGRIGRHRTAYLAISGSTLSALEALDWGLVDHIDADPRSMHP